MVLILDGNSEHKEKGIFWEKKTESFLIIIYHADMTTAFAAA